LSCEKGGRLPGPRVVLNGAQDTEQFHDAPNRKSRGSSLLSAAGTVAAAPKAIAGGVEDGILQVAQSIEERRKNAHSDDQTMS
jgi:hypothetical protein